MVAQEFVGVEASNARFVFPTLRGIFHRRSLVSWQPPSGQVEQGYNAERVR
jgi:hypothetical protein